MAVIAAGKFDDVVATGETSRDADGAHGGFGAAAGHADLIDRGDGGDDSLGQVRFEGRRGAVAHAAIEFPFDGGDDHRGADARGSSVPTSRCSRCALAVDIVEEWPFSAGHHDR